MVNYIQLIVSISFVISSGKLEAKGTPSVTINSSAGTSVYIFCRTAVEADCIYEECMDLLQNRIKYRAWLLTALVHRVPL
jgi:hypothetical protein